MQPQRIARLLTLAAALLASSASSTGAWAANNQSGDSAAQLEKLEQRIDHYKEVQNNRVDHLAKQVDTAVTNSQKAADWWINAAGLLLAMLGLFATVVGLVLPWFRTKDLREEFKKQKEEFDRQLEEAKKDGAQIKELLKQSSKNEAEIRNKNESLKQAAQSDPGEISPGSPEAAKVTIALSEGQAERRNASIEDQLRVNALEAQTKNDWATAMSLWQQLSERQPKNGEVLLALARAQFNYAERQISDPDSQKTFYEQAIKGYRKAIPLLQGDKWAEAQNNLGVALRVLGEMESGTKGVQYLSEAIDAYNEALKERKREHVPLKWASTQNNLGVALRALGEMESGTKGVQYLNEAIDAYNEALKERKREHVSLDWARTQNNLGAALRALGKRESGAKRVQYLNEAVAAYREALKERTRERVPLDWARTQNNLGRALKALGECDPSPAGLQQLYEARAAFLLALEVFEDVQATNYIEETQANLQRVDALIQQRGG